MGVFHTQYHHLFHYPLIDPSSPPISDDIVTGAPRTPPPPQIWHPGDVFVVKRKDIFEKRKREKRYSLIASLLDKIA